MDQLGNLLNAVLKPRYEEDMVDRMNYKITAWILLVSSITLAGGAYVGKPLQCWVPAQFTGGWEQYVEDYCFVENTYLLPFERRIPDDPFERDEKMLNYYQWVPFILAIQALMFMLPHVVWRTTNWLSSLQVRAVISMASDSNNMAGEAHDKAVQMISNHIHDSINIQRTIRAGCGAGRGVYVTTLYIFIKLLFIANLILQFWILSAFLGPAYYFWGAGILTDLINNREWHHTGHFPRVTLCDFMVKRLANTHRFTVQCVLQINMFNEKVFVFLWWWFMLTIIVTVLNLLYWLVVSFTPSLNLAFIERMLNAHGLPRDRNRQRINGFVKELLRPDGVFVLRLMARNAGEVIASHVVRQLWLDYVEPSAYEPNGPEDVSAMKPLLSESFGTPEEQAPPLPPKDTAL